MVGNKKSEKHNARKGSRQLSPREELEIKQRLKRKEKKSTIIKRAITAFILTIVVLVALVGVYLFYRLITMILYLQLSQVQMKQ